MTLTVRRAIPADALTISDFNVAMALETERLALDPERVLKGVRALLEDPAKGFYLVAESDAVLVGQMMITFEWSDWRNATFWWIQSVYVPPQYRRRGVYKRLHQHAVAEATRCGDVCGLRLYVERKNDTAQKVYRSLGMRSAFYDMFEVDFVIAR